MSGGSYDYLCSELDAQGLYNKLGPLESMSQRLAGLGYARDAAMETTSLLLDMRALDIRVQATLQRLTPVWQAVEWVDSCDWGEERIGEALRRYRGQPEPPA